MKKLYYLITTSIIFLTALFSSISAQSEEIYEFERMWPTLQQPWYFFSPFGIAVEGNGNVYVADSSNCRIQKFTPNGQFLTKWGSEGGGDGQFDGPFGIAIDGNGNVYVADTYNDRIQKFNPEGEFITKWGSEGPADGQFENPEGIAIDGSGNVYVADSGNSRIQKFTPNGEFLTKWGG
jgi:tripartite motif-containing protein 71